MKDLWRHWRVRLSALAPVADASQVSVEAGLRIGSIPEPIAEWLSAVADEAVATLDRALSSKAVGLGSSAPTGHTVTYGSLPSGVR
jgi:hypothetical protein